MLQESEVEGLFINKKNPPDKMKSKMDKHDVIKQCLDGDHLQQPPTN